MMIRRLERADYNQVIELLKDFAWQTEFTKLKREVYDYEHVKQVLLRCEKTGLSFVAQDDASITGCILSILVPDMWVPEIVRLRELAWFVLPEYRNQGLGDQLYMAYCQSAEQWRRQGRITGYTMSRLSTTPRKEYHNFKLVEQTYMVGA